MSTLWTLKEMFYQLYELATDDEDQQAFIDTLESLRGELVDKAAGYTHVIKQLEMEMQQCDQVVKEFSDKKEKRASAIKRMKQLMIEAMDAAGLESISAGEYTLKIAKNGGLQPLKIDGDVPDSFTKVIVEPDNKKIRDALLEGQELEFAHLFVVKIHAIEAENRIYELFAVVHTIGLNKVVSVNQAEHWLEIAEHLAVVLIFNNRHLPEEVRLAVGFVERSSVEVHAVVNKLFVSCHDNLVSIRPLVFGVLEDRTISHAEQLVVHH